MGLSLRTDADDVANLAMLMVWLCRVAFVKFREFESERFVLNSLDRDNQASI